MPDAPTENEPLTFTAAVAQLDAAGYDSLGFAIEDGFVVCVDCGTGAEAEAVTVDAMLTFGQDDGGIGHVFALPCPSCQAKGLLFAGTDRIDADEIDPSMTRIVDVLIETARRDD